MTYGWYFRFIFEMALFLLMNSLIELVSMIMILNRHQRFSRPLISCWFALFIIFLYISMIWLLISKLKQKLMIISNKITMKAISGLHPRQYQKKPSRSKARTEGFNNDNQNRYLYLHSTHYCMNHFLVIFLIKL